MKAVLKAIRARLRRVLEHSVPAQTTRRSCNTRDRIDRHGIWRRLWRLSFVVRLVLLDGQVWRSRVCLSRAAAQIWGTLALRLAEADALPFDYTDYANQIRDYFAETSVGSAA